MASGSEDGRKEQKDDWPGVLAAVGGIVLAADTAYLHPFTIASNVISAVGLTGLVLGLLFILRRRLAQFKAAVSRLLNSLKRMRRAPGQTLAVQSSVSAAPVLELTIGVIATLLPFVLIYGAPVAGAGNHVLASLSEYYYSPMRNVLVGGLCALGILFMLSTADNQIDNWLTNLAGITCIGVALFPVRAAAPSQSSTSQIIGFEHNVFIFLMYIALGVMSLRFAASERGEPGARVTRVTHLACGYSIFAFLLLVEFSVLVPSARNFPVILSGETAALMAAGVSWFARGRRRAPRIARPPAGPPGHASLTVPSA